MVALYRSTAYDLQQLEVVDALGQSEQIVATDGHPFYVVDVGWTTADAIQVGQKLVGAGGAVLAVVANRDWKPDGGVVVYNFQVEGDHTYFVGDIHAQGEWVWTHNSCSLDAARTSAAGDKVQLHHPWPKYLGGPSKQTLVPLSQEVHAAYHGGLDRILPRQWGTAYFAGLSGRARSQMLGDLKAYTAAFDRKYGTSLLKAMLNEGYPG